MAPDTTGPPDPGRDPTPHLALLVILLGLMIGCIVAARLTATSDPDTRPRPVPTSWAP